MKLLTIIGTRPEGVKMAPVLRALAMRPGTVSLLASTGQHRELLQAPLALFGVTADFDLALAARSDQDPLALIEDALPPLAALIDQVAPDRIIVQGDTASAMAGARAGVAGGVPVAHVEAGLRTYAALPWPEETFRRAIDAIADTLLAPTAHAAGNLIAEGLAGAGHVTGNSGVDALHLVIDRLRRDVGLRDACDRILPRSRGRPFILVTLHRRENVGDKAAGLCDSLAKIAASGMAEIAFPMHPNPRLYEPIHRALRGRSGIYLLPPLPLAAMVRAMQRCDLILTDSGGIQEEAPSLGKPVLVLREVTERPEGIDAGLARLVGTDPGILFAAVEAELARPRVRPATAHNPYGDGHAAERIVAALHGEQYRPFGTEARCAIPAGVAG